MSEAAVPVLSPRVARIRVQVAPPLALPGGAGREQRFIRILGGSMEGGGLRGTILAGGSDMQVVRPTGTLEIDARFIIDFGADGHVLAHNRALRRVPDARDAAVYFRGSFSFDAPRGPLAWLNDSIFVASGRRHGDEVELDLFRLD